MCLNFWAESGNMKGDDDQHEDVKTTASEIYQMKIMSPYEAVNSPIPKPSVCVVVKNGSPMRNYINCSSSDMITAVSKCVTIDPDLQNYWIKEKKPENFSEVSIKSDSLIDVTSTTVPPPCTIKNAAGIESAASSPRLWPNVVVVPEPKEKAGTFRSPIYMRQGTQYSDWGDVYEGLPTVHITNRASFATYMSGLTSIWSDHMTARESCLPQPTSTPKKLTIPRGKAMGLFLGKQKYRPKLLNLKATVDEVVNLFLSVETGAILPVSMTETVNKLPTVMNSRLMAMTLADHLGSKFDAKTKGLTFCIGSVNSILCYKMTVCELSKMEKILAIFCVDYIIPVD